MWRQWCHGTVKMSQPRAWWQGKREMKTAVFALLRLRAQVHLGLPPPVGEGLEGAGSGEEVVTPRWDP